MRILVLFLVFGVAVAAVRSSETDLEVTPDESLAPYRTLPETTPPVVQPEVRDRQPIPTFQGHPQYPYELRALNIEGFALIDFVVGTDGLTNRLDAVISTHPLFADAAKQAVGKWTFVPGMRKGHPVNVHLQVPIIFSLGEENAAVSTAASADFQHLYQQLLKAWDELDIPVAKARFVHLVIDFRSTGSASAVATTIGPDQDADQAVSSAMEAIVGSYEFGAEAEQIGRAAGTVELNLFKAPQ